MSVINQDVSLQARRYLSPKEVAEMMPSITTQKLANLRYIGEGPRYFKPSGKTILYAEQDIIEWIEGSARTGTAEGI